MTITTFAELTKQVHLLNDLILSDMICAGDDVFAEENLNFSRHMFATKHWFIRISWANKRRYILALLEDLRSAWALSLLLKSIWNCYPKDAVFSISKPHILSYYDQTPMDHNRTALPISTLAQVMTTDRKWFHTLEPENQALVLCEMCQIAGGPIMWEVLRRGQHIYERHREAQLQNLPECISVTRERTKEEPSKEAAISKLELQQEKESAFLKAATTGKAFPNASVISFKLPDTGPNLLPQAQKELDASLANWNAIVKQIRDTQKLEEFEMTFKDGSKRKIWKVNRPVPEAIETSDYIQLLPSAIAKRIFSYLPSNVLAECARVNKYWAFIVDEMKADVAARLKLNIDLAKLQDLMLKHDTSLEAMMANSQSVQILGPLGLGDSISPSTRMGLTMSYRPSEKSTGGVSFRHMVVDRLKPALKIKSKPFRKLSDLSERLNRRGAADENTWKWCENVVRILKGRHPKGKSEEGVLRFGDSNFPCPLMKQSLQLPLSHPLTRDPALPGTSTSKAKYKFSCDSLTPLPNETCHRRFSLWSRNFSSLYKVLKVASYQSPL